MASDLQQLAAIEKPLHLQYVIPVALIGARRFRFSVTYETFVSNSVSCFFSINAHSERIGLLCERSNENEL